MDEQKQQALERLKQANNVLVTVSNNPSVDQLSAAIGFTVFLNKIGKHATAVFSGAVPSTIEFLQPDKTIEKNTDSLRDFIISLDKSKADKLRYKVEDDHVKVFITPYRTSISEKDLEFSQGDFNVDVVVALGVQEQKDLDQAITAHGRILHDATVISLSVGSQMSTLGTINISDATASSLSEVLVDISEALQQGSLDSQMATAFLTGIVAETARFSNEKTTSATMNISAKLMAAGANQQLVATELQKKEAPVEVPVPEAAPVAAAHDGTLEIGHSDTPEDKPAEEPAPKPAEEPEESEPTQASRRRLGDEPPLMGGTLTASNRGDDMEPGIDPLAGRPSGPILSHDSPAVEQSDSADAPQPPLELPVPVPAPEPTPYVEPPHEKVIPVPDPEPVEPPAPAPEPAPQPEAPEEPAPTPYVPPAEPVVVPMPPAPAPAPEPEPASDENTLAEIERNIGSPHAMATESPAPADKPAESPADTNHDGVVDLDEARNAVMAAISENGDSAPLPPMQAIGAQPGLEIEHEDTPEVTPVVEVAHEPDLSLPPGLIPEDTMPNDPTATTVENPIAPPPVPPPMMPPMPGLELPDVHVSDTPMPPVEPPTQDQSNPFGLPPA